MAKLRQTVAQFLLCTLLFVSLASEYSHQHPLFANEKQTLTQEQTEGDFGNQSNSQSLICLVCLFDFSQVIPDDSFQNLALNLASYFAFREQSSLDVLSLPTPIQLRAPPFSIS